MAIRRHLPSGDDDNLILSSILADPRQRRILSILLERSHPLTDRDLAVRLAAREEERPPDVDEKDLQRLLIDLHHRYLPKLETIGWIKRHPEGITTTEQFPFGTTNSSLPSLQDSERRWDILTALLARPRREHIVSMLARKDQSLSLEDLAAELAAHEQISWTTNEDENDCSLSAILHHVDLPRLDEMGLIEYDSDEKTITPERALSTIADWVDVDGEAGKDSNTE